MGVDIVFVVREFYNSERGAIIPTSAFVSSLVESTQNVTKAVEYTIFSWDGGHDLLDILNEVIQPESGNRFVCGLSDLNKILETIDAQGEDNWIEIRADLVMLISAIRKYEMRPDTGIIRSYVFEVYYDL